MRTILALGMLVGIVEVGADAAEPPEKAAVKPADGKNAGPSDQSLYLRRLAVCTKLREIASASNDVDLMAQAEKLETMATELYQRKLKVAEVAAVESKPREPATDAKKKVGKTAAPASEIVEYAWNGRPIRSKEANQ